MSVQKGKRRVSESPEELEKSLSHSTTQIRKVKKELKSKSSFYAEYWDKAAEFLMHQKDVSALALRKART
jgi:hypothetical protein